MRWPISTAEKRRERIWDSVSWVNISMVRTYSPPQQVACISFRRQRLQRCWREWGGRKQVSKQRWLMRLEDAIAREQSIRARKSNGDTIGGKKCHSWILQRVGGNRICGHANCAPSTRWCVQRGCQVGRFQFVYMSQIIISLLVSCLKRDEADGRKMRWIKCCNRDLKIDFGKRWRMGDVVMSQCTWQLSTSPQFHYNLATKPLFLSLSPNAKSLCIIYWLLKECDLQSSVPRLLQRCTSPATIIHFNNHPEDYCLSDWKRICKSLSWDAILWSCESADDSDHELWYAAISNGFAWSWTNKRHRFATQYHLSGRQNRTYIRSGV